ncbi:hypothetical protein T10_10272, partial [Trichinella papuae]
MFLIIIVHSAVYCNDFQVSNVTKTRCRMKKSENKQCRVTRQCDAFFTIKSMLQPEKAEKESSQQHTTHTQRPCMSFVSVDKDKLSREEI